MQWQQGVACHLCSCQPAAVVMAAVLVSTRDSMAFDAGPPLPGHLITAALPMLHHLFACF